MADDATTTPATGTDPAATEPPTAPPDPAALAAALEKAQADAAKWKELSRKNEERAAGNADAAKRLRDLERSSMNDVEAAAAKARDEADAAAAKRWGSQVVAAEVKAAAAHLTPEQQAALIEVVDPTKFLTDTGEVDTAAIEQWVGRAYPKPVEDPGKPPGFPDVAQGARGGPVVPNAAESSLVTLIREKLG